MANDMSKTETELIPEDPENTSESACPAAPCYAFDGVELYHGDCLEILPHLNGIDAVITDPPYGTTACDWDDTDWLGAWDDLWKVGGETLPIVMFASQPFTHRLVMSQEGRFKYWWVWEKNMATNFLHAKRQPLRKHEEICVFYQNPGSYYPQRTRGHNPTQNARGSSNGVLYHGTNTRNYKGGDTTRLPATVLKYDMVDPKCRNHPTEKPVPLLGYLTETYTKKGGTVLDPFMGSGSTIIAAIRTGRKAIGIEKDPEHFKTAKERIERELSQLDLFLA